MSKNERGGVDMAPNIGGGDGEDSAGPGRAGWVGGWVALLALPLWLSHLSAVWLLVGAVGALVLSAALVRRRDRLALAAAVVLWAALGGAAGVQARLSEVAAEWPELQRSIEERAAEELNAALDDLVQRGERAVAAVEGSVATPRRVPLAPLFARLETVRATSDLSALALFDPQGVPIAWAGEHRGSVPLAARLGARPYVFHEGPLFTYLYFVRPLPDGRTAVAAALLESSLEMGESRAPFAVRFADRFGLTPRFSSPLRARGETVWDWSTDRAILSVSFAALTQQHWWERVVERGRRAVGAGWLAGLLLLGGLWYRRRSGPPGVPVAIATLGAVAAPLGPITGAEELFSPLRFVVPAPGDITLGALLVLVGGASVWMLTRVAGQAPARSLPLWLQALIVAPLFPLAVGLTKRSAAPGLLAGSLAGGLPLQLATTVLLALPLYLLLYGGRRAVGNRRLGTALFVLGIALSVALGIGLVLLWLPERSPLPASAAFWAVPFLLISASAGHLFERRSAVRSWLLAVWLAGSATLPHLWVLHTQAELENAEEELARLGTEANPFLDFLLRQFAETAVRFATEGEEGVNLLYHAWVASGLAAEGFEAHLSIWRGGQPDAELPLSRMDSVPDLVAERVAQVRPGDEALVQRFTEVESLHYLLLVPLPDGRVISAVVPPRTQLGRSTALARFLHPESEAEEAAYNETLYLVPVAAGEALRPPGQVEWTRTETGWRSEARAHFPSGWVHAHLFVRTPEPPMVLVRAVLAQAALLAAGLLLWALARLLCGDLGPTPLARQDWVRSFRGRLTLTLFLFFLFPTAVFGAVAYGAVAREVVLSAAAQAYRTLEQAAPAVVRTRLERVGAEVGADLLLYRQGMLVGAAAPEVLDLGLFHTWLPPDVFLDFLRGEDTEAQENRSLGENEYLVAYRRLDPEVALAAPIPLASEEITRRRDQFRDIALLVSLLGAGLSVVLSLLVGRALSRPIAELSQAAATVGSGDLRVRLPEERPDEFGRVYRSFNRMVHRLRRARSALAREARRTETIVAEAATGVLALDAAGRVELVNPRAAEILGVDPARGEPLPHRGELLEAVTQALQEFRDSGALESGREIEVEGRIVRLRLRQLTGGEGVRGTVVALEDVTSEVRTARVLAWGEMARQVAHEIKNPLTPIKLSVQHVRRAFADSRADFGEILERNVQAILEEIDRLGEIARAFSRFGTPQQAEVGLEPVDVGRAVSETLALYRSGGEGIRFQVELEPDADLHAVARMGELKEVLVNLLENARDALGGSGEIGIAARRDPDGGWVEVTVRDTGEGIPAELLPRIFEPHFSTRTSGTGLGLAIVRRLVESWGGSVDAESEPGSGTRVRLRLLPAQPGSGEPQGERSP